MAMNTHRQLGMVTGSQSKSMEKLSSGYRINRAGDDAAGLAISEKMRSQVRGLSQASRNSQDAISLVQTAEGALNETHDILQRMRELAVQASSDTNVAEDREQIQKEIDQLTNEVNRIANTTEFNTMKLLNGDRSNTSGEVVSTTNTSSTSKAIKSAVETFTYSEFVTNPENVKFVGNNIAIDTTQSSWATLEAGGDTNGSVTVTIKKIDADTVSIAMTLKATTGATILAVSDSVDFTGTDFTYSDHGVSFTISAIDTVSANATVTMKLENANVGTLASAIGTLNEWDTMTKVSAGGTAASVGNVTLTGGDLTGAYVMSVSYTGTITSVGGTNSGSLTVKVLDSAGGTLATDTISGTDTINYDAHGIQFVFNANDVSAAKFDHIFETETTTTVTTTTNTITTGTDGSLQFQIGSNEGQSMSLDLNKMDAVALGLAKTSNGAGGAGYITSAATVTNGTDNTASYFGLDLSNADDAAKAISTIDKALTKVSTERSKLGAYQNRLEHTIKNLDTSSENLAAAESRIRDVDMAKEMMEFTKNNILSQAAQSMLSQANQAPQGVLQLLR